MAIGNIGGTTGASSSQSLSMQDFMKILMTQMTYQDPMKPMDNQQFMAQMAQFSALQQTQELNARMDQLLNVQAFFNSVGLIGKNVEFKAATGALSGKVSAVDMSGATPQFTVQTGNGVEMPNISLSQITKVN